MATTKQQRATKAALRKALADVNVTATAKTPPTIDADLELIKMAVEFLESIRDAVSEFRRDVAAL